MRPIERKLLASIGDKGMSFDQVLEFMDKITPHERKQSFPDDCLFQSDRYFAKTLLDGLVRRGLLVQEGPHYQKPKKETQE